MQMSALLQVTCRPHCAMMQFNITVLIETVLPPVLGPVMTIPRVLPPISNCRGTAVVLSIRGCLASLSRIRRSILMSGSTASMSTLSLPFEKIKSSFSIILRFSSSAGIAAITMADRVYRMR